MPIASEVSQPLWLFTRIGRSPAFWSTLPGGPIPCLRGFTFETFKHEFEGLRSLGLFVAAGERII